MATAAISKWYGTCGVRSTPCGMTSNRASVGRSCSPPKVRILRPTNCFAESSTSMAADRLPGRRGRSLRNSPPNRSEHLRRLQLLSLMYVAFKIVAPDESIGLDLTAEHELATAMHLGCDAGASGWTVEPTSVAPVPPGNSGRQSTDLPPCGCAPYLAYPSMFR